MPGAVRTGCIICKGLVRTPRNNAAEISPLRNGSPIGTSFVPIARCSSHRSHRRLFRRRARASGRRPTFAPHRSQVPLHDCVRRVPARRGAMRPRDPFANGQKQATAGAAARRDRTEAVENDTARGNCPSQAPTHPTFTPACHRPTAHPAPSARLRRSRPSSPPAPAIVETTDRTTRPVPRRLPPPAGSPRAECC